MQNAMTRALKLLALVVTTLGLGGCLSAPVRMGDDGARTVATGSAGGASTAGASSDLERCDKPFGTIELVEDQHASWYHVLTGEYRLTSTVPVLRLLMQQSNCFVVVDRGRALANMRQERELEDAGELRAGSNFARGQLVSADYSMMPEVLISARDTSGIGAMVGAFGGGMLSSVMGSLKSNEAATLLTLVDNRSGVQIGVAEGSAKNTDFGLGGLFAGSGGFAGLRGYTSTPQGKVIVAAFMDSYNQLVRSLRNYSAQTMGERGLGTGGRLGVDGATAPSTNRTGRVN